MKSKKKNSITINVMKKEIKIQSMYKKKLWKKPAALLLTGEEGKRHYVLIKDFNGFMNNHTLHRRGKHFCRYCLQAFSTEEKFKMPH